MARASLEKEKGKFTRQPSGEGALQNHETICIPQGSSYVTVCVPDGLKLCINKSQNGYLAIRKQVIDFAN